MTSRQSELLAYLRQCALAGGFVPSFEEMAAHLGIRSKSAVHRLIVDLEERGEIERLPNRARSIRVIDRSEYERGRAVGRREGYADAMRDSRQELETARANGHSVARAVVMRAIGRAG